ncbi:hypothetical protein GIB67_024914 [Kingdonia uniflora]|uniref:Aldehyde dehydrogenase domain-containing protein n=1 Tax=Kingdonia uniflora TaxID=39325 RepID=A0A7J7NZ85_9MAGN|nr:hypothetical protein GIB67_024914 [Kingdonia uniflora]
MVTSLRSFERAATPTVNVDRSRIFIPLLREEAVSHFLNLHEHIVASGRALVIPGYHESEEAEYDVIVDIIFKQGSPVFGQRGVFFDELLIGTKIKYPRIFLRFTFCVLEVTSESTTTNSGLHGDSNHIASKASMLAFTGSTLTGKAILELATRNNLKPITLEIGGKSPFIVCEDVDVDEAAELVHNAMFFNQVQYCTGSSAFVHESVYDEFEAKSKAHAIKHVVGNPFKQGVGQFPC